MKERPILFSAPMVRAILAGTKTQTRRVVKPQPHDPAEGVYSAPSMIHGTGSYTQDHMLADGFDGGTCPYGKPGDQLWVRETFAKVEGQTHPWIATDYRATYTHGDRMGDHLGVKRRWTPSIYMPRAASRILLEIVSVRVERLQEISDQDALAEGVSPDMGLRWQSGDDTPRGIYGELWESINGPGSWDANPWVWVVEFKRVPA